MADALAAAQRDKDALMAMFQKEKEAMQQAHAAEVQRLQDRIRELEDQLKRLKDQLAESNQMGVYYDKVRLELDAALQLPIGKTVSRIQVRLRSQRAQRSVDLCADCRLHPFVRKLSRSWASSRRRPRRRWPSSSRKHFALCAACSIPSRLGGCNHDSFERPSHASQHPCL